MSAGIKMYSILFTSALFFINCNSPNIAKTTADQLPKYLLDINWPQLTKGFPHSHVSAIGLDKYQNIFVLQRTGREWGDAMPDSVISVNTIFLFENETGKLLNSWGANFFIMPHGLTIDPQNNVWVTDVGLNQVFKFNHTGDLLLKLGEPKIAGNDSSHFNQPTDVAIARDGSIYVSDGYRNSRIVKFSKEGKYLFEWGKKGSGEGEFNIPHGLSMDSFGNILVADRENNRIQKFDANGKFLKEWKNDQGTLLCAVAVGAGDSVFAVDDIYTKNFKGDDIILLDSAFNLIHRFGRSDSTVDTTALFHDIVVDVKGTIYVANILGNKVQKFKPL